MSYEEVKRGLPPVDVVMRGTWATRRQPVSYIHPTWALITPTVTTDSSSAPSTPRSQSRSPVPRVSLAPPGIPNPETGYKRRPAPPPPTKRYIIQDGDDDSDMKVIKLDPQDSLPGTLELSSPARKPRKPRPKLIRQGKSTSLTIPTVRVTASPTVDSPSPSTTAIARRARHFIIFLLTLLPPLFFTVAVQYLKFNMVNYGIGIKGICIFQAIFWPSLIFLVFNQIWLKIEVWEALQTGWVELMVVLILAPASVILQIVSLVNLDLTVSLAMTFAPLVIASFIKNIIQEKTFSVELCIASIMAYSGMTLIGLSVLFLQVKQQDKFLFGFSAAVGAMILTIPACLLLLRLRHRNVDDSITAVTFALGGTVISTIIALLLELTPNGIDLDPGTISSLVTFIFFGTIFQFIESKLNRHSETDIKNSGFGTRTRITSLGFLRLSKTRFSVFFLSSFWELIKLGLKWAHVDFPSPLSIFGITFLLLGYILGVGYEFWLRSVTQLGQGNKIRRNRCLFLPWLFFKKG